MRYGLSLIGFGGVNRALVEIIHKKGRKIKQDYGIELPIISISDVFLGYAYDPHGLDLENLMTLPTEKGALAALSNGQAEADNTAAICAEGADIMVEATYTNPQDGEPAVSHCRTAIAHGRHVVTTNKGPVALFGPELSALAEARNTAFEFEGTVMSGTPVLSFANKTLQGCEIAGFRGILNGTANFVLGQVEAGASMADAIKEAQELGYAEADPTADVEGFDVMLKVVILANQLLGVDLKPADVTRGGITGLDSDAVQKAAKEGRHWKLIGQASYDDNGQLTASVGSELLAATDPLSGVSGPVNAVAFTTDLLGPVMVSGPGAGRIETGFALLSDILNIHEKASRAKSE